MSSVPQSSPSLPRKLVHAQRVRRLAGLLYWSACRFARFLQRVDRRIVGRYLAETRQPKLHIGCGDNELGGWLNADLHPRSAAVLRLDAARQFPFADGTFAYVYSEHVIGSLPYQGVETMLRECYRVLAPGGKVRLVTPDLAFLVGLYGRAPSALERRYVEWFGTTTGSASTEVGFIVNQYMKAWQLEVVYDAAMLHDALTAAGFSDIRCCRLNDSCDGNLRHLANEKRMPTGLLALESLTLEARRPSQARTGRPS